MVRAARRMLVLVALVAPAACTAESTAVRCILGTDVPEHVPLTLRATVRRGADPVDDPRREYAWARGPQHDGGIALPTSFTIVPAPGQARDATVTLLVEGVGPSFVLRRLARFAFVPGRTLALPVFLSARCLLPTTGCVGDPGAACTVQRQCEQRGETCGNDGRCVSVVADLVADRPTDAAFEGGTFFPPDGAEGCGQGQPCCPTGEACPPGQVCTSDGVCAACGDGLGCCPSGIRCGEREVCAGEGCTPCGATGLPCCVVGQPCPVADQCVEGRCQLCGGAGQICCADGGCAPGTACLDGRCVACGGHGQPCCAGGGCDARLVCGGGRCVACGGHGQPCCTSGGCDAGFGCASGTCSCRPLHTLCGGSGPPCCPGSRCAVLNSDGMLHCCRDAGAPCASSRDCCGAMICFNFGGAEGLRCRAP